MEVSRRQFIALSSMAVVAGLLEACSARAAPVVTTVPAVVTKAALPSLKVSYGSPVGSFAALWMAKAIGAFDPNNL